MLPTGMDLEKMLRWVALSGIFLLPFIVLIVARTLFFPFITGKNFTFRILVEVIGVAWLALALISPKYRPKRSWLLYACTSFVIIIGIADAFGVYPFKSFWSNYERMEGWVTLAHLFVYFAAAASLLTAELWKRWWQTSLGVSILVACYGLLQLAGLAVINQGGVRLDATLGNATYLAVYMLFHIFIAGILLADEWVKRGPSKRGAYVGVYGGIIALHSLILFFTATRGAMLGLFGGVILAAILLALQDPKGKAARYGAAAAATLLVVGGFAWLGRETAFVKGIEPLQRLTSLSITETTVASRFVNWSMAWEGVKERPLLGWGQENFAAVFDKYYDPRMYAQEPWFDRVHQLILDWLVAGGILGLAAYLSIHAAALWMLWRSGAFTMIERSLITGLLAGYVFYLMFTFDNIISYLLFFSLLGYIAVRAAGDEPVFSKQLVGKQALPVVAACAVVVMAGTMLFVNGKPYVANRAIIAGLSPQSEGLSKNLEEFKRAISYGTYGTQEAREHLSQTAARLSSPDIKATTEVRQAFFETASREMNLQSEASPLNARFPFFVGILHDTFGDYANARTALLKARDLSPRKQSIMFELGMNALARGDTLEALRVLKEAYDLAPEYAEARIYYTVAAVRSNQMAIAESLIPGLVAEGYALDPRILSAYASGGNYAAIAQMAQAHTEMFPQDVQARLTLAAALFESKNVSGALAALEELKREIPSAAAQADAMIAQIRGSAR